MHGIVEQNVSEYLEQNKDIRRFFDRLVAAGKKLFLVTNSPYRFVWVILKVCSICMLWLYSTLVIEHCFYLILCILL